MKLLLRRNQNSGMMRGITFTLDARAELSPEERNNVERYAFGKTMLYQRNQVTDPGAGLLGMASRFAFKMMNIEVTVGSLASGIHLEFKDIIEMLAVEDQLKEASRNFKAILDAAATFGGEEVVELS